MADSFRYALGWLCFQLVMVVPVRVGNPAWDWACGWAGYYANDSRHTASVPGQVCPRCKQPVVSLFHFTADGDELDTVHCGCLHEGNAGVASHVEASFGGGNSDASH